MRYLIILSFTLIGCCFYGQPGLQAIYIEPYYVLGEKDLAAEEHSGIIDSGSVVYRVYLDLEPGYRFQAAYGSPEHPLEIKSDQLFFNHNHSGNSYPNVIPERDLSKNISLLDSWLSAGAATENHLGVPRKYDMIVPDPVLRFEPGFLQNTVNEDIEETSALRMQLAQCDGLTRASYIPVPTFYMVDAATSGLMSTTNTNEIYIDNGAWACMGKGSVGADSTGDNHVLIAQLTTSGYLDLKLNVMIASPEGKSILYVYNNPQDKEIFHPALQCHFAWNDRKARMQSKDVVKKTPKKR